MTDEYDYVQIAPGYFLPSEHPEAQKYLAEQLSKQRILDGRSFRVADFLSPRGFPSRTKVRKKTSSGESD